MDKESLRNLTRGASSIESVLSRRVGGVKTRGGRLPPISTRDLFTKAKKTFSPSIPQRRVQVKTETQDDKTHVRREVDCRTEKRGRGRGRGRSTFIQTTGSLFGEGVTLNPLKKAASHGNYSKAEMGLLMPAFKPTKLKTKQEKEEEDKLFELTDEEYSDDEKEMNDKVVRVPMRSDGAKLEIKPAIKKEKVEQKEISSIKVKKEPMDVDDIVVKLEVKEAEAEVKGEVNVKAEVKEETEMKEDIDFKWDFDAEPDILVFFQFPGRLPFEKKKPDKKNIDKCEPIKKDFVEDDENQEEKVGCSLAEMENGFIGKFQVLQSGEMRMILGNTAYKLLWDDDNTFCQQLAVMDEKEMALSILATLKKKLICYSDVDDTILGYN